MMKYYLVITIRVSKNVMTNGIALKGNFKYFYSVFFQTLYLEYGFLLQLATCEYYKNIKTYISQK